MTTVDEVRSQIAQARQTAQEQRQQVEERRTQVEEAEEQVLSEESKLPKPTARNLRGGLFSGLEGRKRLQVVTGAKKELGARKGELDVFKKELGRFEKEEIEPFESQISQAEGQVLEYDRHTYAISLAKQVYFDNRSPTIFVGTGVKALAEDYLEEMQLQGGSSNFMPSVGVPKSTQPFSPLPVNIVNGQQVQFTPDPSQYVKVGSAPGGGGIFNTKEVFSTKMPSISPPRDLSRTIVLKDFSQLRTLDVPSINKKVSSILSTPFRTTGSPIRMTKLSSLKSRGYIPDRKVMSPNKQLTRQSKPLFFDNKSSPKKTKGFSKEKKKKNFWGF